MKGGGGGLGRHRDKRRCWRHRKPCASWSCLISGSRAKRPRDPPSCSSLDYIIGYTLILNQLNTRRRALAAVSEVHTTAHHHDRFTSFHRINYQQNAPTCTAHLVFALVVACGSGLPAVGVSVVVCCCDAALLLPRLYWNVVRIWNQKALFCLTVPSRVHLIHSLFLFGSIMLCSPK